tara:strand:- start:12997 stop:14430 length:1434 start_codon:yes stop_codon:yes gene_type:complete
MEVIDLGALNEIDELPSTQVSRTGESKLGSGIELLMNEKKVPPSSDDLNLGELDNLENELSEISNTNNSSSININNENTKTVSGIASNLFGLGEPLQEAPIKINTEEISDSNLGQATRDSVGNAKTWDGFSKMTEMPINDEIPVVSTMNEREKRRKKRTMLKKLEEWYEKGMIKHNSNFTLDSDYDEIEDEYETALEDKRKKDGIKLQGWWFMTFINSLEYANNMFNPFDLNLDGWGEQVSEDIDSYEDIFAELHDKYKGGKLAPEISLLLRVGFSAAVLNFSNKALSSATPAFNDVIKQSPELMKMFTNATVNSMSQQSPGFAMANNIMQEQENKPRGPPPPAPVKTQNQEPPSRPGMNYTSNRPDINASRGAMFREQGVDMNNHQNINEPPKSINPPQRQEMKGPQSSDIDNILAGLKTRTVNIHEKTPPQQSQQMNDEDSVISISSLKDIQNSTMPKKSRKRNSSNKNVVSLDI